jgi:hypothetical protein
MRAPRGTHAITSGDCVGEAGAAWRSCDGHSGVAHPMSPGAALGVASISSGNVFYIEWLQTPVVRACLGRRRETTVARSFPRNIADHPSPIHR